MDKAVEHALVRRAREGDEEAIEALIRAHQDALYAFILRMSGRPETAEDIVQEAMVRVLRNIRRFDHRFRFSTWLFTIAKRLYMNSAQKLSPAFDSEAVRRGAAPQPGPGTASAAGEAMGNARRALAAALDALPAHQREIIMLFHARGWPVARIAVHVGLPVGTVKSHLSRGRSRMRRCIEDEGLDARVSEVWS